MKNETRYSMIAVILSALLQPLLVSAQQQQRDLVIKRVENSEKRVALVIGNAEYAITPLANPVNDARAMEAKLNALGFEVLSGYDADQDKMEVLTLEFGKKIRGGGVGLFYFAGHGVQVNGSNFLIPIGAKISEVEDVKSESVNVEFVLKKMEAANNRLNIVILDACRNNPFPGSERSASGGLASIDAPSGTLIAYATAPGKTAKDGGKLGNGLYTSELLKQMSVPGLKIEDVFKQVRKEVEAKSGGSQTPWEHSSLKGDFFFRPGEAAPVKMSPDQALWEVIANSDNPQDFEDYLKKHCPQGVACDAAEAKLRLLSRNSPKQGGGTAPDDSPSSSGSWVMTANRTIKTLADVAWTETLVNLEAGQQVEVTASGMPVNLGPYGSSGPEGIDQSDARRPDRGCKTGAVIARFADGSLACIGQKTSFTVSKPGQSGLMLVGLNVSNHKSNSGSFNVTVKVFTFRK